MITRILRSRPVMVVISLIAMLAAFQAWAYVEGRQKLTEDEIATAMARASGGRLDLIIMLPFEPEQFHFIQFQNIGRMAGADGQSVYLHNVDIADARRVARAYWVTDLKPSDRD